MVPICWNWYCKLELRVHSSFRELHLHNNYLRVLPYELGKLFHLQLLGLQGNPLSKEMLSIYNDNNGTAKLLTYMLDNLQGKCFVISLYLTSEYERTSLTLLLTPIHIFLNDECNNNPGFHWRLYWCYIDYDSHIRRSLYRAYLRTRLTYA